MRKPFESQPEGGRVFAGQPTGTLDTVGLQPTGLPG
jgi:hypothetical protein